MFYKSFFHKNETKQNKRLFIIGSTYGLIKGFKLIQNQSIINLIKLYFTAWIKDLISIKYLLLSNKIIRRFIESIKI